MNGFEPSFLDKLFDDEPRKPSQNMFKRFSLERFKESVAVDLEALFNSRATIDESLLEGLPECRRSVVTYGLRDFSGLSLASSHDRAYICRSLEQAIEAHESRLRNIHVELQVDPRNMGSLHFLIKATLLVHPATEPISFDAMLQPSTLQYSVVRSPVAA